MPPSVVLSAPVQALPAHEVTTEEIVEVTRQMYPRVAEDLALEGLTPERSLAWAERIIPASGVRSRRWVRPLERVLGPADLDAELSEPVSALRTLAVESADAVLRRQGLAPHQITTVISTSVTGWHMPGIGDHVIDALGLPPTVRRIPVAQIGCAGGAWATARAAEYVAADPREKVLVLSAEAFSNGLHRHLATSAEFIYRGLAADGAAAAIVADQVRGPALRLHDRPLDLLLPGTLDAYELVTDSRGTTFTSLRTAPECVAKAMATVRDYLHFDHPDAWPLDLVVCHNGGKAILQAVADELRLDSRALRHSYASLEQRGNMTSAGIWDVLERTHQDAPAHGARGLMIAFGPGFAVSALKISYDSGEAQR